MNDACGVSALETTDTLLLGGKLILRQPRKGHRAGSDAVLLAAAVAPRPGEGVIDCGCGVGSVGLAIAVREKGARVHLVEVVPELAGLARENVARNGLEDRVSVETGDLFAGGDGTGPAKAAWVVSNPPFYRVGETRGSPDPWRARAYQLPDGVGHGDWMRAMLRRALAGARLVMIHRPEALPDLLAAAEGRLGGVRILPVHAREDGPAVRILVGGIVGSRAPLSMRPSLVLHRPDGLFADRAEAVHRGEAALDLFAT